MIRWHECYLQVLNATFHIFLTLACISMFLCAAGFKVSAMFWCLLIQSWCRRWSCWHEARGSYHLVCWAAECQRRVQFYCRGEGRSEVHQGHYRGESCGALYVAYDLLIPKPDCIGTKRSQSCMVVLSLHVTKPSDLCACAEAYTAGRPPHSHRRRHSSRGRGRRWRPKNIGEQNIGS